MSKQREIFQCCLEVKIIQHESKQEHPWTAVSSLDVGMHQVA